MGQTRREEPQIGEDENAEILLGCPLTGEKKYFHDDLQFLTIFEIFKNGPKMDPKGVV